MRATLSILGLYNYDNTIFDSLELPSDVEKDNVINNLLLELSELEVIYPNPTLMKSAIGFWSKKEKPIWEKLVATTKLEYNPIWNLDRYEEYTDTETRNLSGSNNETRNLSGSNNETRNLSGSNNETRNLSGSNNETRNLATTDNETRDLGGSTTTHSTSTDTKTNSGTDTQKEYVSGFNENTSVLAKQMEQTLGTSVTNPKSEDGTETITDTGTVNKSATNTGTVTSAITDNGTVNKAITDTGTVNTSITDGGTVNKAITDTGTVSNSHTAHYKGSIGVVLTQQMIEAERQVVQFNITNYIINSFKKRFCILVY